MTTSTKHAFWQRLGGFGLAGLLAAGLVACDTVDSAREGDAASAAPSTEELVSALDLSGDDAEAIRAAFSRYASQQGEPGYLWYVAADLQERLTDEQKAALFERATPEMRRRGESQRGGRGMRPHGGEGFPRGGRFLEELDLTDKQKAQLEALRAEHAPQMKALFEARQSGELTREAFREQAQALRTAMQEDLGAILTDEQRALLEERRAQWQENRGERREKRGERRAFAEEARGVMVSVLGLTEEQQAALHELRQEHRSKMREALGEARADGADRGVLREAAQARRAEHQAVLAEILSEAQLETMRIHRALGGHMLRHHARQQR